MARAYILRPTGKAETTVRKTWDIISVHHSSAPRPHVGARVLREFLIVENFELLDNTGIEDELRTKRITLADWPVIAYPYEAVAIGSRGEIIQRLRSVRYLDASLLPAGLRSDATTVGKALEPIDAAKVSLTIRQRTKPTGTVTRSTGGILQ